MLTAFLAATVTDTHFAHVRYNAAQRYTLDAALSD